MEDLRQANETYLENIKLQDAERTLQAKKEKEESIKKQVEHEN